MGVEWEAEQEGGLWVCEREGGWVRCAVRRVCVCVGGGRYHRHHHREVFHGAVTLRLRSSTNGAELCLGPPIVGGPVVSNWHAPATSRHAVYALQQRRGQAPESVVNEERFLRRASLGVLA